MKKEIVYVVSNDKKCHEYKTFKKANKAYKILKKYGIHSSLFLFVKIDGQDKIHVTIK